MSSGYFPTLWFIINSNIVLALINDKCNWKVGEQQAIYFDHNKKGWEFKCFRYNC